MGFRELIYVQCDKCEALVAKREHRPWLLFDRRDTTAATFEDHTVALKTAIEKRWYVTSVCCLCPECRP